jgi:hypothetical protein
MARCCWIHAIFLLVVGVLHAPTARAEPQWIIGHPSDELRYTDLSFGANLDNGYGFGFTPGVQLNIPILDSGLIRSINDSLSLEPGLFVSARFDYHEHKKGDDEHHDENFVWVVPEIGPRWNFHLTPNWDVFAAVKLGWAIGDHNGFWMRLGPGMVWWFSRPWALRVDLVGGPRFGGGVFLGLSYQFR